MTAGPSARTFDPRRWATCDQARPCVASDETGVFEPRTLARSAPDRNYV
jgi:hypothetical protein